MQQPALEKLILAKLPLPWGVQRELKKYLQTATPTARLIKELRFRREVSHTFVAGPALRVYELRGRWANPPLRPAIEFMHRYWPENSTRVCWWDLVTGEPTAGRVPRYPVMWLTWPSLEPGQPPTGDHFLVDTAEAMARRVRNWTPVSV